MSRRRVMLLAAVLLPVAAAYMQWAVFRSEERRVGKEC